LKTVDHLQAVETQTVERYVLGELSTSETEDFERHYFECQQCAIAVESASLFVANARAVFRRDALPVPPAVTARKIKKRNLFKAAGAIWGRPAFAAPMAAAFLFGAIGIYQGVVIIPGMQRALNTARALPAFQLVGASRGEGSRVHISAGAISFAISVDLPPEASLPQYLCVLTFGDHAVFNVDAPAPAEGQPITILVPAKGLQPGTYELSVFASRQDRQQGAKIAKYSFDLQFDR
jgi:hypothetical protein